MHRVLEKQCKVIRNIQMNKSINFYAESNKSKGERIKKLDNTKMLQRKYKRKHYGKSINANQVC